MIEHKGMLILQVCVDSQKDSPDSCVETCPPSSYDADHSINIKVEEISDVEVEEDPLKISLTGVETEHAVSCFVSPRIDSNASAAAYFVC
jgi:hypothetical protein